MANDPELAEFESFRVDCFRQTQRLQVPPRQILWVAEDSCLTPFVSVVKDISRKGIGLVSRQSVQVGTVIGVLWHFGPKDRWRKVPAKVVRVEQLDSGASLLGCKFEHRLELTELGAFVDSPHR